jgi:eukaryotic-like serine/threonine-protein kinase
MPVEVAVMAASESVGRELNPGAGGSPRLCPGGARLVSSAQVPSIMSLSAGQRLGPYEILGPLGAGGMGEVWTARDTRLDRPVAIKVLPRDLASSPDRRARFEREARAISSLSHPHVCALFDVGRAEGPDGETPYLVMERLEGETLAARLSRGALPVPEALVLGSQLAGALAAAHRRGIVHRDLKPANVMLTRAGAKLLDFGLARRDEDDRSTVASGEVGLTEATEAMPLTRAGTLVGTLPYLSPERLRGHPADTRADLFAFGCVLFEALAGRRAFPGTTAAEITTAILVAEPADVREAAPGASPGLAALVRQCLAKDPDARWQCADDVARGLRLVEEGLARPAAGPGKARTSRWAFTAAVLGLVAATAATAFLARRAPPVASLHFTVTPPAGVLVHRPTMAHPLAASPDGRRIVFTANSGGVSGLWLWSAEDGRVRRLEDAAGGVAPFFSPDGQEIAFFAGDDLRRVPAGGGPSTTITGAALGSSGTWGDDGTILFTRPFGSEAGLYSVPARGGEVRAVVPAASYDQRRAFPRFLPGGSHYLFLRGFGAPIAERQICVASLGGGEPYCFASCHSQGEYSASGHVLCIRSGTLVALPFSARSLRPTGEAVTVARDVRWFGPSGSAAFSVSADGSTLVYEPRPAPSRLAWLDRDGREIGALGETGPLGLVQLSPDGRRVAVDIGHPDGRGRDVWSLDTGSGVATRHTFAPIDAWGPAWSPDGTRLAFARSVADPPDVTVLHLDGSGREEVLLRAPGVQVPRHWSPDGRLIAYDDSLVSRREQRQLWLLSVSDGGTRRVTSTPFSSYHGRFSPDGGTLAYVSEESGQPEVYLADLAGKRPSRRVSRSGGVLPRFRGDGGELFYLQPDGMMMVVPPVGETAVPRSLFHLEGVTALDFDYDVARDGRRFLVRLASEADGAAGLRVALGWSRLPAGPDAEAR